MRKSPAKRREIKKRKAGIGEGPEVPGAARVDIGGGGPEPPGRRGPAPLGPRPEMMGQPIERVIENILEGNAPGAVMTGEKALVQKYIDHKHTTFHGIRLTPGGKTILHINTIDGLSLRVNGILSHKKGRVYKLELGEGPEKQEYEVGASQIDKSAFGTFGMLVAGGLGIPKEQTDLVKALAKSGKDPFKNYIGGHELADGRFVYVDKKSFDKYKEEKKAEPEKYKKEGAKFYTGLDNTGAAIGHFEMTKEGIKFFPKGMNR